MPAECNYVTRLENSLYKQIVKSERQNNSALMRLNNANEIDEIKLQVKSHQIEVGKHVRYAMKKGSYLTFLTYTNQK